jgi:adsorption protein B
VARAGPPRHSFLALKAGHKNNQNGAFIAPLALETDELPKGGRMGAGVLLAVDVIVREAALFAAVGFLILGTSDLAVDLLWIARALRRPKPVLLASLPAAEAPGRIAVFVPAWDESAVIAAMLRHACAAWGDADYLIFVGCYPNDPDTIAEVRGCAGARVQAVVGPAPGPTTKADCLNRLWDALGAEEAASGRFKAVALHDAEDVVHPAEIALFDALVERYDLVQLPVLPLIDEKSRWIAGHYADEFAEAHAKALVVRSAIGAALPSAGVGCAVEREALGRLAERHGVPFDADSVTEDYELGLRLRQEGGRAAFVRVRTRAGGPVVATREYFPATWGAAIDQKARWIRGIALSGWDRLGWSGGLAERWMRMRDRQAILAALLLAAGYASFALWTLRGAASLATGWPPLPIPLPLHHLLLINLALLGWRLAMRFGFTAFAYGWREGLRALPRTVTANLVEMLAARQAVARYATPGAVRWDKTAHAFPEQIPAE